MRNTPQQNRLVERMDRTLLQWVRCILSNAKLLATFGRGAVRTMCYLINGFPSTNLDFKTPIDVWLGEPPKYVYLRIFGCIAYIHVYDG